MQFPRCRRASSMPHRCARGVECRSERHAKQRDRPGVALARTHRAPPEVQSVENELVPDVVEDVVPPDT